jgi:hypothetical protein
MMLDFQWCIFYQTQNATTLTTTTTTTAKQQQLKNKENPQPNNTKNTLTQKIK